MFYIKEKPLGKAVEITQDNDYVYIVVNGKQVAWFVSGDDILAIDFAQLKKLGIHCRSGNSGGVVEDK